MNTIEEKLLEARMVFVSGLVNQELALRVTRELHSLARVSDDPITLWINSPGGEVYSGFSIYDTIQFIRPKVTTIISGTAASMASVIALAAEKENRLIQPNSKILLHQPLIGGELKGPASDIEIHAKDIVALKKRMYALYAERTGTPQAVFEELMERDYWVSPEEAVKLGLVQEIVSKKAS